MDAPGDSPTEGTTSEGGVATAESPSTKSVAPNTNTENITREQGLTKKPTEAEDDPTSLEGEELLSDNDESWTPEVGEVDEDKEEMDPSEWKLDAIIAATKITIGFNVTDTFLERKYIREVDQVRSNLMEEYSSSQHSLETKRTDLSTSEVHNTLYPAEVLLLIMSFQNRYLKAKGLSRITLEEFQYLVRCINGLSFYRCSLVDLEEYSESYPLLSSAVDQLLGGTF